jgi:3-phosphoshikimate 1-carboxyvinyltransferase
MIVVKPGNSINGQLGEDSLYRLPGDKSISHRAALLGAMAEGECVYQNFLVSGVTRVMLNAISEIGVNWELADKTLAITGRGLKISKNNIEFDQKMTRIDCGNSGTTMRLLAGALSTMGIRAVLDGSPGLRKRPMTRIIKPLSKMGVSITATNGCAPLYIGITRQPIIAFSYDLPIASAQVKSCLLLAALSADGTTVLSEPGPSRDHTERMLQGMGVTVEKDFYEGIDQEDGRNLERYVTRLETAKAMSLKPIKLTIPGDISAASFLITAALICKESELKIQGLGINPTRTGLLEVLIEMGADMRLENERTVGGEPVGDIIVRSSKLEGVKISGSRVVRMIDEFPILAVAAAYAKGITDISGASELRYKETDRISSLCKELRKIGIEVDEKPDGFTITGGRLVGDTTIDPHGDHRLAMAFTIAGLESQNPIQISNPEIVKESFPDFIAILKHFGANIVVEN